MKPNKSIGVLIIAISFALFVPSYLHYNYKHFIKLSKALLIYEHNKNYNRKMSFPDKTVYRLFNAAIDGSIEQITFTDLTLASKTNSLRLSLLGDKPYFYQLENKGLNQNVLSYVYEKAEIRSYLLQSFKSDKYKLTNNEAFMYRTIFLPYLPSTLGHLRIQGKNNQYLVSYGNNFITADITTNEKGLINSITTQKYIANYSNYKNEKGVQIPQKMTINNNDYNLKKIKMNIFNTRR
jgi:hypothetical protein